MLIRRPQQVQPQTVTMPGAEGVTMRLMVGRADGAPTFAMRMFELVPGGHTPKHEHNYEHEVLILEGRGEIAGSAAASGCRAICAGDVIFIPPQEMHQFRNTGDQPLKFICLVPTEFNCGAKIEATPGS